VTMLDYTAIDFETANSYRGSPCAVGLVRVRDGRVVDERRWLIRPPEGADWFDSFNVWVHGITAEMVADAPRWKDTLPAIIEFIGDDVVVAHNSGFDIGVIRYACAVDNIEWPQMRFLCTLVATRRALALPSYRLPFVTEALGYDMGDHHDPLDDARAVTTVVAGLAAQEGAETLEELASALNVYIGRMESGVYRGSVAVSGSSGLQLPEVNPDADPNGHLYGRVVVFTGKLWAMVRQDAWNECARVGAVPEKNTTQRTNVLVIGDLNPAYLRPGENLSAKARKAFALQDKGQDIEVMTEDDFIRCLDGKPLSDHTDLLGSPD
jgi:DNA polymerase III subunit epsilon